MLIVNDYVKQGGTTVAEESFQIASELWPLISKGNALFG